MKNKFENVMDDVIELIMDSKHIYIASHVNPDGDNIGSTLALTLALKKLKKDVIPLTVGDIPSNLKFLPELYLYSDRSDDINPIDLFIALDSGDIDRLGNNIPLLNNAKNIINIDHHISNSNFGTINLVDKEASSTGEIIFKLIKKMGIELDTDIATCLYTAISTDTGSFIYDNVTEETHEIAAELIKIGFDKKNVNIQLYSSRSIEKTNLFIDVLSTLRLYEDNKIAVIKVTQEMLKESDAIMDDSEGIVSFVTEIEPVEVACILKESKDSSIKISIRSKRYINVAEIASYFNGGGHIRAAGCTINENIQDAETIIVNKIKEYFR